MTKTELLRALAGLVNVTQKDADTIWNALLGKKGLLVQSLSESGTAPLGDFGTLKLKISKERPGINPATKAPITIKAQRKISLTVSKGMKEMLNP